MDEKERLVKAAESAKQLRKDLQAVLVNTDNLALDELVSEAISQVEVILRRSNRFAGEYQL